MQCVCNYDRAGRDVKLLDVTANPVDHGLRHCGLLLYRLDLLHELRDCLLSLFCGVAPFYN